MAEDPTEHVHEDIDEHAHGAKERWIGWAALTAALLAVLAAITGSLASGHLTESSRAQIASNDLWNEFQSNSVKAQIVLSRDAVLAALGKALPEDDARQREKYESGKEKLQEEAKAAGERSERHHEIHETLERGETFSHIAIAAVAIAVLTKRRAFWAFSGALGVVGVVYLVMGIMARV